MYQNNITINRKKSQFIDLLDEATQYNMCLTKSIPVQIESVLHGINALKSNIVKIK